MKRFFSLALLWAFAGLMSCSSQAPVLNGPSLQQVQIVPLPQQVSYQTGKLSLSQMGTIAVPKDNASLRSSAQLLSEMCKSVRGFSPKVLEKGKGDISLRLGLQHENPEAYRLQVSADGIDIQGASEAGVFWGVQSLQQMLYRGDALPYMQVLDYPRFAYRGAMLDVGRHFFPMEFLKKYVDALAMHKVNKLHWHLTEDQGWRLEIKKYPKLQEVASKRKETLSGHMSSSTAYDGKPYGGYYTQEEARELVRYAAERHITIIPEIEMPGHAQALLAAYPEMGCTGGPYEVMTKWGVSDNVFCAGNDQVFTMLEDILDEVLDIFPSHYIHIGGDECPKTQWQKCPKCQARIKNEKLHDEHHLQSYFISRMERYLNSKGRDIIGWDEILEGGLAPNATVMSWRGMQGGIEAAKQGHDVIMTPTDFAYFDYYQAEQTAQEPLAIGGYLPVRKVYEFEPVPADLKGEERKRVIGAQANIWTEYIPTSEQVDYMTFPRLGAMAEVMWSEQPKNWDAFLPRLAQLTAIYKHKDHNFATHIFGIEGKVDIDHAKLTTGIKLYSLGGEPIYYTLDGSEPTEQSTRYEQPLKLEGGKVELRAVSFPFGKRSAEFRHAHHLHKGSAAQVTLAQAPAANYAAQGGKTLVDGVRSEANFKNGRWIGIQGKPIDATFALPQAQQIDSVTVSYMVDLDNWIFAPASVAIYVAEGEGMRKLFDQPLPACKQGQPRDLHTVTLPVGVNTQSVRVCVEAVKSMPSWHGSAGKQAHLFVDEVLLH